MKKLTDYSEKNLQLFVSYTILEAIRILKLLLNRYSIFFCNYIKQLIRFVFLRLNVVHCKFIPVQWIIIINNVQNVMVVIFGMNFQRM